MHSRTWTKWLLLATLTLALGLTFGCGAKEQVPTSDAGASQVGATTGPSGYPAKTDDAATLREKQLAEAKAKAQAKLTDEKVYFDFDKYDLKPVYRDVLKGKADILKQFGEFRVIVEGHCDERGTEEYNLALGERRARAVYEYLILLGVNAAQLEMVSYGEERPAVQGNNEAAWAKNRRAEFKVLR